MCKIAITNRKLCNNLLEQLEILNHSDFDYVILREKDLTNPEYFSLAEKAIKICKKRTSFSTCPICILIRRTFLLLHQLLK